jgi:hypothetical protein
MGPTGHSSVTRREATQAVRMLSRQRIAKWLLLAVVLGPVVPGVGIASIVMLWMWRQTAGARDFVHEHFEAVRHKKASAPSGASADSRAAYAAVATSTGEEVPNLPPYMATSDAAETCLDAELVTKSGRRPVSLVVRWQDGANGASTFEAFDISLTRRCACSHGKWSLAHCQLE